MLPALRIGLLALLGFVLAPASVHVEAICGHCYGSHTCLSNSTFQVCFDGVPSTSRTFECPRERPICTPYSDICQLSGSVPGCGDTSKCEQCSNGEVYACASLTTFGSCDKGEMMPERSNCPDDWYCSPAGAARGDPCVLTCDPDTSDSCDRVAPNVPGETSPGSSPGTTEGTTPIPASTPSTTTAEPSFVPNAFCQSIQKSGNFALPNDTVCTSFVNCFFRGSVLQGSVRNCLAAKPYFSGSACSTTKPSGVGCK